MQHFPRLPALNFAAGGLGDGLLLDGHLRDSDGNSISNIGIRSRTSTPRTTTVDENMIHHHGAQQVQQHEHVHQQHDDQEQNEKIATQTKNVGSLAPGPCFLLSLLPATSPSHVISVRGLERPLSSNLCALRLFILQAQQKKQHNITHSNMTIILYQTTKYGTKKKLKSEKTLLTSREG